MLIDLELPLEDGTPWHHPFSTYAKFSEKLTFLTP